jgi:hypothetical protein
MFKLIVLLSISATGCCCQRQMTVGARFDPYNQARPVDNINVQVILTK